MNTKNHKLTIYDFVKVLLYGVAIGLMTWGCLFSRGHMFLGFVALACAFVAPDAPDEEEDVI